MKKILTVAALTAAAAFALAGCGKKAEEAVAEAPAADTSAIPEATTAPTPDPVLPAEPSTTTDGTAAPAPPPTLPPDPADATTDTMGPPPKT